MSQLPWLCVGDFNEILRNEEKSGDCLDRHLMDNFIEALDWCELNDMAFKGPDFTWSSKRDGRDLVQEWLDRVVCCINWHQAFSNSVVQHLDFWNSDHKPILINVLSSVESGTGRRQRQNRRFHFKACWVNHEDCRRLVEKS